MRCRAAVLHRTHAPFTIEEIEVDPPGPREVLVRMAAAGVCHSDWHVVQGVIEKQLPIILGHEGAGTVVEVGPEVTLVRRGDPVILSWVPDCGRCAYCVRGRSNLCELRRPFSEGTMLDGGIRFHLDGQPVRHFGGVSSFSEYAVVPEAGAIPLRSAIPLERAALFGCCVTTGVGAVLFTAQVEPGSSVAIFGAGGVGLNAIQGATIAAAGPIIVVDLNPRKLEFARRFGATAVVDASAGDPVEAVLNLTGGEGVDYAFEAVGLPVTMEQAFACLRKGGTAVAIGVAPIDAQVCVSARQLVYGERALRGSFYGSARPRVDFERLIGLYRDGRLRVDELVSRVYALEEINEAFTAMLEGGVARGVIRYP